ncbi:hypothetical protein BV22DRAFT_1042050 [Leucogyrophana mollusca]|uniref:Uncharacterized protein n=1 Tax=Leucogyrophana mollusca TaxID=85980 RepID=A0ACB8AZX1_9AGAM|nr:hypothetical protein BV22DRAFT_1042050 [Leucogyrophana mollusca]
MGPSFVSERECELDPFLVTESSTRPSIDVTASRLSVDVAAAPPGSEDDDTAGAAMNPTQPRLKSKPIRRGILDRLKFGALRHEEYAAVDVNADVDVDMSHGMPTRSLSRLEGLRRGGSDGGSVSISGQSRLESLRRGGSDGGSTDPSTGGARGTRSLQRPGKTYSPAGTPRKERGVVRGAEAEGDEARTRRVEKDDAEPQPRTVWVGGSGFRIMQSHGDSTGEKEHEVEQGETPRQSGIWDTIRRKKTGRQHHQHHDENSTPNSEDNAPLRGDQQSTPTRGDQFTDRYTTLPQRRPSWRKRSGVEPEAPPARLSSIPRIDSSILPRSPPLLMSPPLASTLFFTSPPLQSSTSLSLVAARGVLESPKMGAVEWPKMGPVDFSEMGMGALESRDPKTAAGAELSPELFPLPSKKRKATTRKLRSPKPPPLLPFPSYKDASPPRPTKVRTRDGSLPPVYDTAGAASPGEPISPTSRVRMSKALEALAEVDEIVLRGYTGRRTSG